MPEFFIIPLIIRHKIRIVQSVAHGSGELGLAARIHHDMRDAAHQILAETDLRASDDSPAELRRQSLHGYPSHRAWPLSSSRVELQPAVF